MTVLSAEAVESLAFHEAGHFVAARAFGVRASAVVRALPDGTADGVTSFVDEAFDALPEADRVVIALAGAVAQALHFRPSTTPLYIGLALLFVDEEDGPLSPSDRALVGDGPYPEVERTVAILREEWELVEKVAGYVAGDALARPAEATEALQSLFPEVDREEVAEAVLEGAES